MIGKDIRGNRFLNLFWFWFLIILKLMVFRRLFFLCREKFGLFGKWLSNLGCLISYFGDFLKRFVMFKLCFKKLLMNDLFNISEIKIYGVMVNFVFWKFI